MINVFFVVVLLFAGVANAQWDYNIDASKYNPENSQYNPKNSVYNPDNSIYSPNRKSVYNEQGDNIGYGVEKDDGDINIFDDTGERIGYIDAPDYETEPKMEYENYYE